VAYPARFQLVAAMNPCPCGRPDEPPAHCANPAVCCQRYQSKLSGPLLDRIDLQLAVRAVPLHALHGTPDSASSAQIRTRVLRARERQLQRSHCINRDLQGKALAEACQLSKTQQVWLANAADKLNLSARAYHRILRVARTIADLEDQDLITESHLGEALSYRLRS
jgi:magnesium chelatase family protein